MARRRRRAAPTRPIEYEATAQHYTEASVLKPVGPSTHTDDWPCFLLSDATVHLRDGTLTNQLDVDMYGPFVVRGRLELEKDNERYLVNRNMKAKTLWIQIESSQSFSVGAKDDTLSAPVVWASGKAGWFEIVPSPCYQRICDEMFQAVRLHYSLLDQYEEALEKLQKSRKKKRATMADVSIEIDELLFQYALRAGDGLTLPEAYELLDKHSIFLLSHFPKDTSIYNHLANGHPVTRQNLVNKGPKHPRLIAYLNQPCALEAHDYSHRDESSSRETVDERKRGKGRPKKSISRTTRASETSDSKDIVDVPKNSHEAHQSRSARLKKRSPTGIPPTGDDVVMTDPSSNNIASSETSRDRRVDVHGDNSTMELNSTPEAKSSAHVLADALEDVKRHMLQLIREGKQKKPLSQITTKGWQTKVYLECNIKQYNSVGEIFQYHARDLVQRLGPEWHDTQIYQWAKANASKPPTLTLITETDVNQIVRRVKKSTRTAQSEKVTNEKEQLVIREYAGKQTPKNRPSGKVAGLRPSTGSKKRLRYDADFEDDMDLDENGSLRKKSKKSHYFNEDDDEDEDDNNGSVDGDEEESSGESRSHAEKDTIPVTQLVIRAEKLPSTQPQGPNQTWTCDEPDCNYVVRAAHEDEGQKLISTHFEEHEKEAQDEAQEKALNRVNLAVQESGGHLPINHLLEKIRNLGEKSKRRDEVHLNGHSVPEPIKRTLFI
ncbi:hypothetical protein F4678DRAFT_411638 [Xylaria arbuscula]|nr:hypothetical protein F4678DRAFT_411638 [Xylaria arbuscula]